MPCVYCWLNNAGPNFGSLKSVGHCKVWPETMTVTCTFQILLQNLQEQGEESKHSNRCLQLSVFPLLSGGWTVNAMLLSWMQLTSNYLRHVSALMCSEKKHLASPWASESLHSWNNHTPFLTSSMQHQDLHFPFFVYHLSHRVNKINVIWRMCEDSETCVKPPLC